MRSTCEWRLLACALGACAGVAGAGESSLCDGDLTRDGFVDAADLNLVLGFFDKGAGGDATGDGQTDSADLNLLLGAFGTTGCPTDEPGPCCEPHDGVGCDVPFCNDIVCALSMPSCCDTVWDAACVDLAIVECQFPNVCFGVFTGPCCVENFTPGCEDEACTELVCERDVVCCDSVWDAVCADIAFFDCEVCN